MQYLISLYFDEKTDKVFRDYMQKVADHTGNTFMLDHQVPPHITVAAFEAHNEDEVIGLVEKCVTGLKSGTLQWVTVGALPSGVLYAAPVLNEYLHRMSELFYNEIKGIEGIKISRLYQPFQWMPHVTLAKKLTEQELAAGFAAMISEFACKEGKVVRIGLATKQPYREIREWKL